jgi:signal transduction histidine kinase
MKKVAVVFVCAVFVPSLVLAWLAIRSLRDQQIVVERQQALLYQGVADALAKDVQDFLRTTQRDFAQQVEALLGERSVMDVANGFDEQLRQAWSMAEVGFVVSLDGNVLSPSLFGRAEAHRFRLENERFLCNREIVEVDWNSPKAAVNRSKVDEKWVSSAETSKDNAEKKSEGVFATKGKSAPGPKEGTAPSRSKVEPGEAEFRQLLGDSYEGTLARFLQDKLKLLLWYRSVRDTQMVFGAQLDLAQVITGLRELVKVPEALQGTITVALLDDNARPVAGHRPNGQIPFVSREIGAALPHWEAAVYLQNPASLTQSAQTLKLTVQLIVALLLAAIGVGGTLIVLDLKRQLALARQKTDFVSNVSHELKTPLTSIRMFSELLAEGRIEDPLRQKHFLQIITAETARLTRLINNVLDFARMERGEKKYHCEPCDLTTVVRETVNAYRPHLEANGFKLESRLPEGPVTVCGDRDALSQIVVNLLSNAEKYSGEQKDIAVHLQNADVVELSVLDRGRGVPRGCEEKIFEQFYRAHDSLASGIQGSGLGLTLARQIARAHGGDILYRGREGGGSCFVLRLPASS